MAWHNDSGFGWSISGRHDVWAPPYSHQTDNAKTEEKLYHRSSCTVAEFLGPTTDFPTWGSGKGTENPQAIWLRSPVGFDFRISKDWGNRLLEGTNKTLSIFIPFPKRVNANECSNYHTIVLTSHASKVMLKILQVRLQHYVNWELTDLQAGFRESRGTEVKLPTSIGQ